MEHTAALLGHAPQSAGPGNLRCAYFITSSFFNYAVVAHERKFQLWTMPPDAAKDSDPVTRVHWSSAPGAGKMTTLSVRKTNTRVTTV